MEITQDKELKQAGYKLLSVILIESNFKREINIDFKVGEVANEVDIQIEKSLPNEQGIFSVYFSLNFRGKRKEAIDYTAFIKIAGVFQKLGEPDLSLEDFCDINGPAIIFPFIREHLAGLSMKASINQILLPPINFTRKK